MPTSSLTLIGMPGSGKSTIGDLLAKRLGKGFVDTDLLIEQSEQKTLQQILSQHGYLKLREFEQREILNLKPDNLVIATGGSAVHSSPAIQYLRNHSTLVFLRLPLSELKERINNFASRGIAKPQSQSFDELFIERQPLYEEAAHYVVDCGGKNIEQVVDAVLTL